MCHITHVHVMLDLYTDKRRQTSIDSRTAWPACCPCHTKQFLRVLHAAVSPLRPVPVDHQNSPTKQISTKTIIITITIIIKTSFPSRSPVWFCARGAVQDPAYPVRHPRRTLLSLPHPPDHNPRRFLEPSQSRSLSSNMEGVRKSGYGRG